MKQAVHGTNSYYVGHKCRCASCTEAHRIYNREWSRKKLGCKPRFQPSGGSYRKRYEQNVALLAKIKTASGCIDCGYNAHPHALDFDHVRGVKMKNVSQLVHYEPALLLAEIEKCDVVCANCHRIRTTERRASC